MSGKRGQDIVLCIFLVLMDPDIPQVNTLQVVIQGQVAMGGIIVMVARVVIRFDETLINIHKGLFRSCKTVPYKYT